MRCILLHQRGQEFRATLRYTMRRLGKKILQRFIRCHVYLKRINAPVKCRVGRDVDISIADLSSESSFHPKLSRDKGFSRSSILSRNWSNYQIKELRPKDLNCTNFENYLDEHNDARRSTVKTFDGVAQVIAHSQSRVHQATALYLSGWSGKFSLAQILFLAYVEFSTFSLLFRSISVPWRVCFVFLSCAFSIICMFFNIPVS